MWILVAGVASATLKMVLGRCGRVFVLPILMTRIAQDGAVRSFQRKTALHVTGHSKCRRFKRFAAVTAFAFVFVRRGLKLALVNIVMTCGAGVVLEDVCGRGAVWNVALCTCDGCMLVEERKLGPRVLRGCKGCGLEPRDCVTDAAIAAIGARGELTQVNVLPVAIQAPRVSHRSLEIARQVAGSAGLGGMLAFQPVLCCCMIEVEGFLDGFPVGYRMARLAARRECALMRIAVTRGAVLEGDIPIFCVWFRSVNRRVAFLAGDFLVRAIKDESGTVVIESRRVLPARCIVAGAAFKRELSVMFIGVASGTIR